MQRTGRRKRQARDWKQLIERLGSDDFGTRMEAGAALCGGGKATLRALTDGLDHPQWKVRARCAQQLGELADESYLKPLCRALHDPAVGVRRAALNAVLSACGAQASSQTAVMEEWIERALFDASVTVQRRAVHGLGLLPYDVRAVKALHTLVQQEAPPKLLRLARWALEQQERKAGEPRIGRQESPLQSARVLLKLGPKARLPRLETLDTPQLVELLGAGERHIRSEATGVLFHRGPAALDALMEGLSRPNDLIRRGCVGLMDHLADNRCVLPLFHALQDPDEQVRRGALHSLTCQACKPSPLQGDIIEPLIERALTDLSLRIRRVATGVLGDHLPDARAAAALQSLLERETDSVLRSRARQALARHGDA